MIMAYNMTSLAAAATATDATLVAQLSSAHSLHHPSLYIQASDGYLG